MKKVYLFYIYGDAVDEYKFPGITNDSIRKTDKFEYSLYAYTIDKKIKKIFLNTRKNDLFYTRTITMTDDEFNDFEGSYDSHKLDFRKFKTKGIKNGTIFCDNIRILCTCNEFVHINFDGLGSFNKIMSPIIAELDKYNLKVFNDEIVDALYQTLDYLNFREFMYFVDKIYYYSFDINLLSLFFNEYQNTFNIERIDEACQ